MLHGHQVLAQDVCSKCYYGNSIFQEDILKIKLCQTSYIIPKNIIGQISTMSLTLICLIYMTWSFCWGFFVNNFYFIFLDMIFGNIIFKLWHSVQIKPENKKKIKKSLKTKHPGETVYIQHVNVSALCA